MDIPGIYYLAGGIFLFALIICATGLYLSYYCNNSGQIRKRLTAYENREFFSAAPPEVPMDPLKRIIGFMNRPPNISCDEESLFLKKSIFLKHLTDFPDVEFNQKHKTITICFSKHKTLTLSFSDVIGFQVCLDKVQDPEESRYFEHNIVYRKNGKIIRETLFSTPTPALNILEKIHQKFSFPVFSSMQANFDRLI